MCYNPNIGILNESFTNEGRIVGNNFSPFFLSMNKKICFISSFMFEYIYKVCSKGWSYIKLKWKKRIICYSNAFNNGWRFPMIGYNNINFIRPWSLHSSNVDLGLIGVMVRDIQYNLYKKISSFNGWQGVGTVFGGIGGLFGYFPQLSISTNQGQGESCDNSGGNSGNKSVMMINPCSYRDNSFFKDSEEMDYFFQGLFLIIELIVLSILVVWFIRKA